MLEKEKDNLIFGLDIGTRTIIGIVGYKQENKFVVVATKVIEHESRAMLDGQIHDILAVSRSANKVKESLEAQTGITLKEVAIAAAGRVLKTVEVNVSQKFEEVQAINSFMIKGLELQGIQKAQEQIPNTEFDDEESSYFYVGHSVVSYYLNNYAIANLEEQKGKVIGADVLATFLPKVVVDSLYTVMDKIGLTVTNLTLEPIAAMNAVIPPNLRLLNLALVDIGAGTSDIAITKEGSVRAYGMIPLAGDAITEKIVHTYLVDFETAENIKQQLASKTTISFLDIIGISHEVLAADIQIVIKEVIEHLGTQIASKIKSLNGNSPPNAVFCVGGGSQAPYITDILADQLALPIERVSIRGSEHATMIIDDKKEIKGPESITPLGICLTTMEKKGKDFISITVNNKPIELLHTKNMTISDAVIAIGFDHTQIISVRGTTLMFKLNGERIRIKGGVGSQPRIICNNKEATLETSISQGDQLKIYPAQNGEDGQVNLIDLIHQVGLGKEEAVVRVNGAVVDHKYQVENSDDIIIMNKLDQVQEETQEAQEIEEVLISDQAEVEEVQETQEVTDKQVVESPTQAKHSEPEERRIYVVVNDEVVSMPYEQNLIFVMIFDYIDFDLSSPQGNIVLKLNGQRAAYTDILKDGDQIEIYWE